MWIIFPHTSLYLLFSSAKENKRASSSRKRGRPKGQKKENQAPEQKNEKNDDWSKEIPECPDVKTPEKTLPRTNEEVTKMSFSDDDEDMNVDFDVDTDDDDVGNYKNGGDSDTDGPTAVLRTPDLEDEATRDDDRSKTKEADSSTFNPLETETVSPVGEEDQRKRQKHEDGRGSSSFLSTGKKSGGTEMSRSNSDDPVTIKVNRYKILSTRDSPRLPDHDPYRLSWQAVQLYCITFGLYRAATIDKLI